MVNTLHKVSSELCHVCLLTMAHLLEACKRQPRLISVILSSLRPLDPAHKDCADEIVLEYRYRVSLHITHPKAPNTNCQTHILL